MKCNNMISKSYQNPTIVFLNFNKITNIAILYLNKDFSQINFKYLLKKIKFIYF